MANLTWALVIVLCVDLILFLGQTAVTDLNPTGEQFFNCQGSTIGDTGNCTSYALPQEPKDSIPGGTLGIEPTTGNIFTDVFTSIRSFIVDKTGLGNLLRIVGAPAYWLADLGAPAPFTYAVGAFWYAITFFLLISFIWGRQGE